MNISGHIWTVAGLVARTVSPKAAPPSERWTTTLEDPDSSTVRLSGRLSRPPGARNLAVLVHGLGGSSESGYMAAAAKAAFDLGIAALRLNLRGADGEDSDIYHGGLTADLRAAVIDLAGLGFERIVILGFSLGGHVALRYATEVDEPEVLAIAAVCSPLDLAAGVDVLDSRRMAPYRRYILRGLKENYEKTAPLGRTPIPRQALSAVRTIREWDSLTVVPRFGFRDANDYYARASVRSRLACLRRPALLVAVENDPMVVPAAVKPALAELDGASSRACPLTVRWVHTGGHLAFSRHLDLGYGGPRGYASQCLQWLVGKEP